MPRQPAAIDRDKLRAAVRTLGHEDVFYMLDDAIDVIFFADEGGSWQVGVDWERVLPPWFRAERTARRGGARAARRG